MAQTANLDWQAIVADSRFQALRAKKILIATGSAPVEIPSLRFDRKSILSSTEALSIPEILDWCDRRFERTGKWPTQHSGRVEGTLTETWKGIDLAGEARRHYASVGLDMPDFDERLRCYLLHIGLGGIAYAAWRFSCGSSLRILPTERPRNRWTRPIQSASRPAR